MLSKSAQLALGAHTAGIYADMSIDGPVIGTLVAIIDRAKNLPNRKTMGKQNPYCACRLAKEAKKTDTDMRGGQTPKWDQELRFTVHGSPDYYQLKVSVFNDDKRTDLIGETWVDLKNVIIPGGGQSDSWHTLNCKGKYAGEIRFELTYYDTRPKDDSVVERRKEAKRTDTKPQTNSSVLGPRQSRPPKRRPLPADPTGASPPKHSSVDTTASRRKELPALDYPRPPPPEQLHSAPQPRIHRSNEMLDDHRRHRIPQEPYALVQTSAQPLQAHNHPNHPQLTYQSDRQAHHYTPESSLELQNHSIACRQYYSDPNINSPDPQNFRHAPSPEQHYSNDPQNIEPTPKDLYHRQETQHHSSSVAIADNTHPLPIDYQQGYQNRNTLYQEVPSQSPDQYHQNSRRAHENPPRPNSRYSRNPDSSHGSHSPVPRNSPHGNSDDPNYGASDQPQQLSLYSPESRNGHHHRYSVSSKADGYRDSPLRKSVSQSDYQHRHYMQPQVQEEDEEGPPPPPPAHRQGLGTPTHIDTFPNQPQIATIPEPLTVTPKTSPRPIEKRPEYIAYSPNHINPIPTPDSNLAYSTSPVPSYHSVMDDSGALSRPRTSGTDTIPSSLVAGYDSATPRNFDRPVLDQNHGHWQNDTSLATAQATRSSPIELPERRSPRASAAPRQILPRKSVSPHPLPAADPDSLSGIPFSPDSYDSINPNVSRVAVEQPAPSYESADQAMEAARQHEVEKLRALGPIIGNDGRTIDPSDHLPADTWAPEPARKSRKPEVVVRFKHAPSSNALVSRADRGKQNRPQSIAAPSIVYQASGSKIQPGPNRLQKGSTRPQSYAPSSIRGTSPQSSSLPRQRENFGGYPPFSTSPNAVAHYNTSAPPPYSDGSRSPTNRYSGSQYPSSAPPVPSKIPIHPGSQNYPNMAGNGSFDALSEEMKRIDIGAGNGGRRDRQSLMGRYKR